MGNMTNHTERAMSPQQFHRGNVVRVADNLGSTMSHFRAGADAVVIGSYADQYGGDARDHYTIMFLDDGHAVSWYYDRQLTLVEAGGEHVIERVTYERTVREKQETSLAWIVANWSAIRENPPGATVGYLMRRIGITQPWGSSGEGFVYYENFWGTVALLDPHLSTSTAEEMDAILDGLRSRVT